ncbi:hypothetical protein HPP92_020272 [Vanilla planifolia]|uniref:Uncharacterized protein n=1 Tax=Vanilla planifolia TaxID=51239 RepID=A0A835Q3U6_VANPL|nr:hypothetical protein HPP92_020272 [Vanilla planifolia]
MNSSPFMDKQIMGLSGSPTVGIGSGGGGGEFFDLMNPQEERRDNGGVLKKEEILPSYDFQPIRPSSSLPASSGDDAARHSRFSSGPLFGETGLGPDFKRTHHHGASMDDVENTVKKHADILYMLWKEPSSGCKILQLPKISFSVGCGTAKFCHEFRKEKISSLAGLFDWPVADLELV